MPNHDGQPIASQPSPVVGRVAVEERAIATVVHDAVVSCYGVVDFATGSIGSVITKRLRRSSKRPGIDVVVEDGRIGVELSLVVQYGTPIFTVARNVITTVTFQVERTLGMQVDHVNVHVSGLRDTADAATPAPAP